MVTLDEPTAVTVPLMESEDAGSAAFEPDVPDELGVELELEPEVPLVVEVELGVVVVVVAAPAVTAVDATVPATAPNPRSPSPLATALGNRRFRAELSWILISPSPSRWDRPTWKAASPRHLGSSAVRPESHLGVPEPDRPRAGGRSGLPIHRRQTGDTQR